jgi:TPR repeat protein
MFNYARRLQNGACVERNVAEAVKLFRGAADRGHGMACFTLWLIYARGLNGVQPDPDKARRFARVGAKHRNVGCMLEYADLLGDCDKATQHRPQALSDSYAKEQVDMARSYE